MACQGNPRAHDLGLFGGYRRHVERVFNRARVEVVGHLLRHLQGHVFLRFACRCAKVRRADHVGEAKKHVLFRRLNSEHIKRGTSHMARFQQISQRFLINETTARAVNDADTFLGFTQVLAAEDIGGRFREGHVQRDEIGAF